METPEATWIITAYRVQPLSVPYIEPGKEVLCFRNLIDAYAYVETWYGEDCHLYEVTGSCTRDSLGEEDFQVDYRENEWRRPDGKDYPYAVSHKISVVTLKVQDVKVLGRFSVTVEDNSDNEHVITWKFTSI